MKKLPQSFTHNGNLYSLYFWKFLNGWVVGYKTQDESDKHQAFGCNKIHSAQRLLEKLSLAGINPYND